MGVLIVVINTRFDRFSIIVTLKRHFSRNTWISFDFLSTGMAAGTFYGAVVFLTIAFDLAGSTSEDRRKGTLS